MADEKAPTEKESAKKIKDLKIELLKNPTKKKSIKKEIARLLTMATRNSAPSKKGTKVLASSGHQTKLSEGKK